MLVCCRIPGGKRNTLVLPIDRSLVSRDRQLHVGCSRPRCHRGRDNVSQSVPRDAFPYSAPSGLQLPWTGSDTVVGHHDAGKWQRPELQTPSHRSKWMPPALSVSSSAIFTSWQGHESAMPVKTLQRWFVLTWVCDKDRGDKVMGETRSGWRLLSVCDYKWSRQHSDLVIGKVGRWISRGISDQGGGRRVFLDCARIPTQRDSSQVSPLSS